MQIFHYIIDENSNVTGAKKYESSDTMSYYKQIAKLKRF